MNYQLIHDKIIVRASERKLKKGIYVEKHHVVPKCLGGRNEDGIVKLTAKEHYIIHRLLTLIYPESEGLQRAFWMMCFGVSNKMTNRFKVSPRTYEEARIGFGKRSSKLMMGNDYGKNNSHDEWSKERKKRHSNWRTNWYKEEGNEHPRGMLGKAPWNKGLTKDDPRVLKNVTNAHETLRNKRKNDKLLKVSKSNIPRNKNR